MNAADLTLQRSFPSVMVPRREPVAPMQAHGERLLIAQNGVFLEISQPWTFCRRKSRFWPRPTAVTITRACPGFSIR
jgi:PRTRC genetic system protein A